jgi:hypothetical protein
MTKFFCTFHADPILCTNVKDMKMKPTFFLVAATLALGGCAEPVSEDDIKKLSEAPVINVSPNDELADLFHYGTDSTDLQRSAKLKELTNAYVKWRLTVYEIKQISEKKYLVVTGKDPEISMRGGALTLTNLEAGVRATLWILDENDLEELLALRTGSEICLKGKLTGADTLRHLDMRPAILCNHDRT